MLRIVESAGAERVAAHVDVVVFMLFTLMLVISGVSISVAVSAVGVTSSTTVQ
jgi:hypothetical protein